jgi:AraC family transcriptional activator of mtrCDE
MDWLSRLLDMVPVRGRVDYRCFFGAPWRVDYDALPPGEMPYHIILGGRLSVADPSGALPPCSLVAGDILLLPHGTAHVLSDGSGAPASPVRSRPGAALTINENDGAGERLDMLCGRFILSSADERLLRRSLPPRLVVRAPEHSIATAQPGGAGAQLAGLITLMRMESVAGELGGLAMLNGLSSAMFALILRLAGEAREAPAGLLAVAGNPRLAPALAALFNEPARPWSLPELAGICHMSRATFVRHFQERMGRSAADMLTDIRMTLAAAELRRSSASTGAVGEAVGYQSEAAFQRAFKQHMGQTPAQWRRSS